jgi:acetoin utilization protein AcuB
VERHKIKDYMTAAPVSIALDAELDEAIALMQEHGIRHLPVTDGGALTGIVSERDLTIVQSLVSESGNRVSVAETMTPEPYCVPPDAPLSAVAQHMADAKIGCAIVEQPAGQIVGLFTTTDALRALAQLARAS